MQFADSNIHMWTWHKTKWYHFITTYKCFKIVKAK